MLTGPSGLAGTGRGVDPLPHERPSHRFGIQVDAFNCRIFARNPRNCRNHGNQQNPAVRSGIKRGIDHRFKLITRCTEHRCHGAVGIEFIACNRRRHFSLPVQAVDDPQDHLQFFKGVDLFEQRGQ